MPVPEMAAVRTNPQNGGRVRGEQAAQHAHLVAERFAWWSSPACLSRQANEVLSVSQPCAEKLDGVVDSPGMFVTSIGMCGNWLLGAGHAAQGTSSALQYIAVFSAVWH